MAMSTPNALSITQDLLDQALRHAEAAGGGRITHARIVISEWQSLDDEAVRLFWQLLAAGTPAAHAELSFQYEAALADCPTCGHRLALGPDPADVAYPLTCPVCQSQAFELPGGNEAYLDSIDVERLD